MCVRERYLGGAAVAWLGTGLCFTNEYPRLLPMCVVCVVLCLYVCVHARAHMCACANVFVCMHGMYLYLYAFVLM